MANTEYYYARRDYAVAYRTYCRAYRAMSRALGFNGPFDFPTLHALSPSWARTIRELYGNAKRACERAHALER